METDAWQQPGKETVLNGVLGCWIFHVVCHGTLRTRENLLAIVGALFIFALLSTVYVVGAVLRGASVAALFLA